MGGGATTAHMKQDGLFRRFGNTLAPLATCLAIFLIGLRYAYYSIFSQFRFYDDEGTMMLRVLMLVKDPATYDSLSGVYGPFYYLHKYALHGWLNLPISHDVNRLTTIVLWGFTAAACALLVHRLTRSVVLAAVVQMQLILHLGTFVSEPGHPHEIALAVISAALLSSSFVTDRRWRLFGLMGLGAATGALLLVKINLGAYLAAAVALAFLVSLPSSVIVGGLTWLAALVAMVIPAAVMWRHIQTPWGQNYATLVTLAIGASFIASVRRTTGERLRWRDVAASTGGATLAVSFTCAVLMFWGNSFSSILNSVIFRPLGFSSTFVIPAPIGQHAANASVAAFLLALLYVLVAPRIRRHQPILLALACAKLAYAGLAFYGVYTFGPGALGLAIPIPFLWLLLIRTDTGAAESDGGHFPRVVLSLVAAFQTLQAYPVHGSQATWAVFLVIPLSAVCAGDALRTIRTLIEQRLRRNPGAPVLPMRLSTLLSLLLLGCVGAGYYSKANLAGRESAYWLQTPLSLPGASRLRFAQDEVAQLQWLAKNVNENCDGFVGMPGFGSLYFWTRTDPPASMNSAWILNLEDAYQSAIVEKMRTYERPCIVENPSMVGFWTGGRPLTPGQPLVRYVYQEFRPGPHFGRYTLLLSNDASRRSHGAASSN